MSIERKFGTLACALVAIAAGAGSSCSKSSADEGTIPFTVQDQIFYGGSGFYELKILDYSGACALEQASDSHVAGSEYIEIDYNHADPPGVGTYSVPGEMVIELHQRDSSCNKVVDVAATSGTVTITSETASLLEGSFTANLPGYGTVAGTLSAAFCDTTTSTGPSTCVQP
jgi:hypothetical protein